ncbi:MAG: hypothetical protein ACI9C2_000956, partial [Gammaproteobacteria bacterium]
SLTTQEASTRLCQVLASCVLSIRKSLSGLRR